MLRGLCLALLLSLLTAAGAGAATLTPVGDFGQPIFVTSDPDDASRLLVVEREGRVAELTEGGAAETYADLTAYVSCCSSERGLLSIAPDPDFHDSGLFYAAYTGKAATAGGATGDIHVDAFTADADANVTRTPIITVGHSQEANHNGGQIQFGPDGYLYISTGDGGGGGDPFETGQSLTALLGKVLRIDPEPGTTARYSIPAGNPFAATAGADEIWAYGLRNPWRFSFDSLNGDMVIGDVGQGAHEEVDFARSPSAGVVGGGGANYGWSCREGFSAYTDSTPSANCVGASGFTEPVFDYPHSDPGGDTAYGCSITGGYVVRDPSVADLYGRYVYSDYCTGEIRSLLLPGTGQTTASDDRGAGIEGPGLNPTSFGEDACHRVYVTSGGTVYRLEGAAPSECTAEEPPDEEPPGEEGEPPPRVEPPAQEPPKADPPGRANQVSDALPTAHRVAIVPSGQFRRYFKIVVEIRPCRSNADYGYSVQLNRGGRRVDGDDDLSRGCRAAFFLANVSAPATFRALAFPHAGGQMLRSKRLTIMPPEG